MGQQGNLILVNGTPYAWERTQQGSYQLEAWNFPTSIPAKSTATIHVKWKEGVFVTESDSSGGASYKLLGTDATFQVQARAQGRGKYHLQVVLDGLATQNNAKGSTIPLGFRKDGFVKFVLSGKAGNFTSNNPPVDWMHSNLATLDSRSIRQICMPGSHDAGMSVRNGGTVFGVDDNIITQRGNVAFQLQCGSRYFDIRPAISAGRFVAGHYSALGDKSWQGGNGQSLDDVIREINDFASRNKELIIIDLSHDINTDVGNKHYRPFNQEEWDRLFGQLKSTLKNLYIASDPRNVDLTTIRLGDIIRDRAAVIVIARCHSSISLEKCNDQGIYRGGQFPIYDSYSNSPRVDQMSKDQLQKMAAQRTSPDSRFFLLSWTLTQDATLAVSSIVGIGDNIVELADKADPVLYQNLLEKCTTDCYPNVLYVDGMESSDIAALAMAVNNTART